MTDTIDAIAEWISPDAPVRYSSNRRCSRGEDCIVFLQLKRHGDEQPGKVRSTVQLVDGVLLCDRCEQERVKSEMTHRQFVGKEDYGRMRGKNALGVSGPLPNLSVLREATGLSQMRLSKETGMWATTISMIERGNNASEETAQRLADFFGVTVEYMRGETSEVHGHEATEATQAAG